MYKPTKQCWPRIIFLAWACFLATSFSCVAGTILVPWGDNYYGQTNIPTGLTNVVSIAGSSSHNLALNRDGSVSGWGWNTNGQASVPPDLNQVAAIAAGGSHSLALRSNGMVVAWGANFYGQTNVPTGLKDVGAIAGGGSHSLALKMDGAVVAWGNNDFGQSAVPALGNIVAIAAGGWHSLALKADGTVIAWGYNGYGQTDVPPGLTNVVAISAGAAHSVALKAAGTVVVWGNNDYEQTNVPGDLSNVVDVAAGAYHVLALKADGTVSAWGYNYSGQTNVPAGLNGVVAIADRSLALVGDGEPFLTSRLVNRRVVVGERVQFRISTTGTWPLSYQWQCNGTNLAWTTNAALVLTGVDASQAGMYSVLVSNAFGVVSSAGANLTVLPFFIMGHPQDVETWRRGTASFSVAVETSEPVTYQWSFQGQQLVDDGRIRGSQTANLVITNLQLLDSGGYFVVVSDGFSSATSRVASLVVTNRAPILTGQPQDQVVDANSKAEFTVVVSSPYPYSVQWQHEGLAIEGAVSNRLVILNAMPTNSGNYWCVVSNIDGVVTSAVAQLTVLGHAPVILTEPQNVITNQGRNVLLWAEVSGTTPMAYSWQHNGQSISRGTNYLLALPTVSPSDAGSYQLTVSNLLGTATSAPATVTVICSPVGKPVVGWGENSSGQTNVPLGLNNVVAVAAGVMHGLALKSDGTVVGWGYNNYGQTSVPPGLSNVTAIAGGLNFSLALKEDGTVVPWGTVFNGQAETPLSLPPGLSNVVAIAAGYSHMLALKGDGTVFAAGYYSAGQTYQEMTVPAGLSNIIGIAAGGSHSLALRADRTVVAWGNNDFGQATVPLGLSNAVAISGGQLHSVALKEDGTVVAWGYNSSGQGSVPAEATNVAMIASGAMHNLALKKDGALLSWGDFSYDGPPVGLTNILAISAGSGFNLALRGNRGPYLTAPLPNQVVPAQSVVRFQVSAAGVQPLRYQWQSGGNDLVDQTNSVLEFQLPALNVLFPGAGTYSVRVTDALGLANVFSANLAVLPMVISLQPQSQVVSTGEVVGFSVVVKSVPPVSYQWRFQGVDLVDNDRITGANASELTIRDIRYSDAGDYWLVAQNVFWVKLGDIFMLVTNTAASERATLVVTNHLPSFTWQPVKQFIDAHSDATFSVGITSVYPYQVQWQHDGEAIPGATNTILVLHNVWLNDEGSYWCVASNQDGVVTSHTAILTVVLHGPTIFQEPADQKVDWGATASFWVGVSGTTPLIYQWQHDEQEIPGATNSSLLFYPVSGTNEGNYRVIITNIAGVATSMVARLTVIPRAPEITRQPTNTTVDAGWDVCFDVGVSGAPYPVLQWQFNERDIAGANGWQHCLQAVTLSDVGRYRLVASNMSGVATSATATLSVRYRPPEFTSSPQDQSVWAGSYATFNCSIVGGPKPSLQWLYNGMPIAGANETSLALLINSTNQAGKYAVVASNLYGSVTSVVAQLTVLTSQPSFTEEPVTQGVVAGNAVELVSGASGSPPPNYQWIFEGSPLAGATNATLLIPQAKLAQGGSYFVIASNEVGAVTSRVAQLVVSLPGPLDRWEWRRPLPQGNDLYCATYGNGIFVALGRGGARVRSLDEGVSWQSCNAGEADIYDVAYGNGRFVATGVAGLTVSQTKWLQTSPDGAHWEDLDTSSLEEAIVDVAFGKGRFVGLTGSGGAMVSTDGLEWASTLSGATNGLWRVRFVNGVFVALGQVQLGSGNTYVSQLEISADGVTWTNSQVEGPAGIYDLAYGNNRFVACGALGSSNSQSFSMVSPDGISWGTYNIPGNGYYSRISYNNGMFLAVAQASPMCATSVDGMNWTVHDTGNSNNVYAIVPGRNAFVAVGDKGVILRTTNGGDWSVNSPGSPINLRSVSWGRNLYVGVGNEGLMLTSSNGVTWAQQPVPTTVNLRGVTFGSGRFVAVGDWGANGGVVLSSADGREWSGVEVFSGYSFYNVAYGLGRFVAVGWAGLIATSFDGHVWTRQNSGTTARLNAITFNGEQFVAAGQGGVLLSSTNASEWVARLTPTSYFLQGIACGNGLLVAVGDYGTILTSTNAVNWTFKCGLDSPFRTRSIEDLQFANGQFMASGEGGYLATSPDGVIWTPHLTGSQNTFRSTLYAGGYVMAVGNNETIMQSDFFGPPVLHVRMPSHYQGFEFGVDAEVGGNYRLQASDDLVNWENIFTFSNTRVSTVLLDEEAEFSSHRFYRVVAP